MIRLFLILLFFYSCGTMNEMSLYEESPINNNKFVISAIFAINPKILYLIIINITTKANPIIKDNIPITIKTLSLITLSVIFIINFKQC